MVSRITFGAMWTLIAVQVVAAASNKPLRVVASVDLPRYAGKWFEIARLPNKLQDQCAGDVVAQYALKGDGRIDIVNRCRTADGKIKQAHGVARKAGDGKNNARLQVRFAPAILSFLAVWGDYWIIGLGPDYTWAVAGSPSREYLWILSRAPTMSASSYEQALEIAKGNGFDVSRLLKTTHTESLTPQ
jgi:apolipoprotein D and lipocalin family protein